MPNVINATSTGNGGLVSTGDDSGILNIQTNETTAITVDASQRVSFVAGTAALPAITTTGDTNTGIFFPAADTIAFSEGGAEAMRIDSSGNVLVTSAASLGYGTGSGGSVTQATSKGTGVTINKANGRITMNNAALGAGSSATFLVSNSLVASTDTVVINVNDAIRGDLYNVWVWYVIGGGFYVVLKNIGGSSYSDAVVLNFSVIKATTS